MTYPVKNSSLSTGTLKKCGAMRHDPPQIVVLASGNGTTFEAIAEAARDGRISASITELICNRVDAPVLDRAERMGVNHFVPVNTGEAMFNEIHGELRRLDPDLIVLAGFMRILPDMVIEEFGERMINTHPSLLPCFGGKGFYGDRVHMAVIESGARVSGCTVHFVTADVDGGPIIAQTTVPVMDSDDFRSLAERVHGAELTLLVNSIQKLLTVPYTVKGKRVLFRG